MPNTLHLPLKFHKVLYISENTTSLHFRWKSTVVQGTEVHTPKTSDLTQKNNTFFGKHF